MKATIVETTQPLETEHSTALYIDNVLCYTATALTAQEVAEYVQQVVESITSAYNKGVEDPFCDLTIKTLPKTESDYTIKL
jgi:hypothetical protein